MSKMFLTIHTRMRMRGAGRAKAEAKSVSNEYKQMTLYMDELEARQPQVQNWGLTALNYVSVLQLVRFGLKDIQDLASGKGGLGDMLSLATTLLILQFRLGQIMQANIALSGTLAAAQAATGLGPLGLGIAAGTIVGGVVLGGLAFQQQQRMAEIEAERAMREQIAQSLGLISQQENLTQTMTTATRQNLIDTRSMGNK